MNVLILPDSFKNSLSSAKVGEALAAGIRRVAKDAHIAHYPVADGGEGTVDAFVAATHGKVISCPTHDALGRAIEGFYGLLPDGTVVVEMAAASGIQHLSANELNPLLTSTYGTGEIILSALNNGHSQFIIGLGGSATNDGGTGMARALGYRFQNKEGQEIADGGAALSQLEKIDDSQVSKWVKNATFRIACDVQNPLAGPQGASVIYGPQKGATPAMVKTLNKSLAHLAKIIAQDLHIDVEDLPCGGAAGGLGAGAFAFLGGQLMPGFEIVSEILDLKNEVQKSDIVLTGEGKMDVQTCQGKTPYAVAQLAKAANKKVIAFAGQLGEDHHTLYNHGFDAIFPIADKPMTLNESITHTKALLSDTAERVFRVLLS